MKDVAALAGVSMGTVSNVLNSPDKVSEPTRLRVEDAIRKLGWSRNESARQLRAGVSHSIGMVVMDIANPFFTDVISGAERAVEERGLSVQLGNSGGRVDRERAQLRLFEEQRVRGVLLAPIEGVADYLLQLHRRGIPVVIVDRAGDDLDCCSVSVDDLEGGRLAVDHLVGTGHRRIAFVGGPGSVKQVRDRRLGAELAVGAVPDAELVVVPTTRLEVGAGVAAAEQIAATPVAERPTAVFAANDLLALGLLQGLITSGLRVPDDVAIVGYDDISFAEAAAIPLSSVRQPRETLGERAAALLFSEIADDEGEHRHEHVRFSPELVVRRSSAAPVGTHRRGGPERRTGPTARGRARS